MCIYMLYVNLDGGFGLCPGAGAFICVSNLVLDGGSVLVTRACPDSDL
uniref:Uncharacterized protein n=1 Tax=Anguilla anguilla TaxID=7936 RepID=A0A0E9RII7_ANGAN